MDYQTYRQMRAYSRYDGIYLAILWLASFALAIIGPTAPIVGAVGNLLVVATPFFVGYRLRKYRDDALGGHLAFKRALLYCLRVFFNGGLLFALLQWAYMKFLDGGRLLQTYRAATSAPEMRPLVKAYGISQSELDEALRQMFDPFVLASYSFVIAVTAGVALSLIIAAVVERK